MKRDSPTKKKKPKRRVAKRVSEIIDDLCCRFIANCPDEEWTFERICFQIEQAHWFYEDFYRENNNKLPQMTLKVFTEHIFEHCPLLKLYQDQASQIFDVFKNYKMRVPVYGAIMLNETLDKCLLVQGWSKQASWGFPRGKVNKDELGPNCAVREVFEETGFSIAGRVSEQDHLRLIRNDQECTLYIIPYVSEDTIFEPQTRKEIRDIRWANISDLSKPSKGRSKYFLVAPFIKKLRKWIKRKKVMSETETALEDDVIDTLIEYEEEPIVEMVPRRDSNTGQIPTFTSFKFDRQAIMDCFSNL